MSLKIAAGSLFGLKMAAKDFLFAVRAAVVSEWDAAGVIRAQ
ncbi:hypothetical protein [Ferrovibrio sp.]|nr:hypothetical protein [Ferrovibrio sp.]